MEMLSGKVAVVTGAAQGMGLETACEFARRGAFTVLTDINQEKLSAALESVRSISNNAAIFTVKPFEEIGEEEWDRVFAVNVKGVLFGCQAV